jgi:hypothetical protein
MKTNIHLVSYLAQFLVEWERFQKNVVEKIRTRILCSITFFPRKSCHLWHNVEMHQAEHATDHNTAFAHCMLDTQGYKLTPRICNIIDSPLQNKLNERSTMLRCSMSCEFCFLTLWVSLYCFCCTSSIDTFLGHR